MVFERLLRARETINAWPPPTLCRRSQCLKPTMKKINLSLKKPVVAVHWGRSTLDYVVADRKKGQVLITAAGSLAWDAEEDQQTPGDVLRGELQRLGLKRLELIVALGRGSVDVIPLQLPPSADEDLATLVTNQVMRDAGDIAESGVVDYVALPGPADEPRSGFAFAVESNTMQQVKAEAGKAGVQPSAIVYRPLASVTLLQRVVPQSRRTMILITRHDREADISIVRDAGLVYTRTARLSETTNVGDIAAQLAMETRRSLAAASLVPDAEEQHLYVFGALQETEQLVQELAEELSLPASLLDPLRMEHVEGTTPESVGRLSPLLGMIYEHYGNAHGTDFLNPKKPPAPPNPWRRAGAYAAAVLVLLGVGLYILWDERAKSAQEIAALKKEYQQLAVRLNKVKQKQAVVDAVWQWQSNNVNWLDEFFDLARRFPSGRDAMIRRFSVSPGRGGTSVIDLSVYVRDPDVITEMGDELRDSYHDVRSKGVSEQSSSDDYPWQFETRITLRPRGKEQYQENVPTEPEEDELEQESSKTESDIAAARLNP